MFTFLIGFAIFMAINLGITLFLRAEYHWWIEDKWLSCKKRWGIILTRIYRGLRRLKFTFIKKFFRRNFHS